MAAQKYPTRLEEAVERKINAMGVTAKERLQEHLKKVAELRERDRPEVALLASLIYLNDRQSELGMTWNPSGDTALFSLMLAEARTIVAEKG